MHHSVCRGVDSPCASRFYTLKKLSHADVRRMLWDIMKPNDKHSRPCLNEVHCEICWYESAEALGVKNSEKIEVSVDINFE